MAVVVQLGCEVSDEGVSPATSPLYCGETAGVEPYGTDALCAVIVSVAVATVTDPLT